MNTRLKVGDAVRVRLYLYGIGGLYGVIESKLHVQHSPLYRVRLENGRIRDLWSECLEKEVRKNDDEV